MESFKNPVDQPIGASRHETRSRPRHRSWVRLSLEQSVLIALLAIYLVKGIWITGIHPPFTGHDEVAHYAYLQIVAVDGRIPLIPDSDMWKSPATVANPEGFDRISPYFWGYCRFSTQDWSGCGDNQCPDSCYLHVDATDGKIMPAGWIYTANHPPLYYLLMTPIFWLTDGHWPEEQLPWFRMAAIPFGMLTVLLAYLTMRQLFPGDRFLAITVPIVVAFQPQVSYEAAMLNNDILAIALASAVLWLTAIGIRRRFPVWTCVLIGFTLGLALLTKTTSITVASVIAVGMILTFGWRDWKSWMSRGAIAVCVTALTSWPWYFYMLRRYGDANALDRIRQLQWWNYPDGETPTVWSQLTDPAFFWRILEQSFGGFGWHLIPLSAEFKTILAALFILGVAGLSLYVIRAYCSVAPDGGGGWRSRFLARRLRVEGVDRLQAIGLTTLGTFAVVSYAALLQFGVQFQGTQARYAFPSIIAVATLLMFGLKGWVPQTWLRWMPIVVAAGMILLNYWIYARYVFPWLDSST